MNKLITFKVEGSGSFPGVMLKRDGCWPVGDRDVDNIFITLADAEDFKRKRVVELRSIANPNQERWRSFNWPVIELNGKTLKREGMMEVGQKYLITYFIPGSHRVDHYLVGTLIGRDDGLNDLVFNTRPAAGTQSLDRRHLKGFAPTTLEHGFPKPLTKLQQDYYDLLARLKVVVDEFEIQESIRRMNAAELRQAISASEEL